MGALNRAVESALTYGRMQAEAEGVDPTVYFLVAPDASVDGLRVDAYAWLPADADQRVPDRTTSSEVACVKAIATGNADPFPVYAEAFEALSDHVGFRIDGSCAACPGVAVRDRDVMGSPSP